MHLGNPSLKVQHIEIAFSNLSRGWSSNKSMDTHLCLGLWQSGAYNYGYSVQGFRWGITPSLVMDCWGAYALSTLCIALWGWHRLSASLVFHIKRSCVVHVWTNEWTEVYKWINGIFYPCWGHIIQLFTPSCFPCLWVLETDWGFVFASSDEGQKTFENGSWSYAIDYGVGGKSPLEPSFNFAVELTDNSKVLYLSSFGWF